mgnify:CR=1 FL=1
MTKNKKEDNSKWLDEHVIFNISGLSKKENRKLRDRILKKVADKFDKKGKVNGSS